MSASTIARLRLRGPLSDALRPDSLATLGTAQFARWLDARRWYGSKGSRPEEIRVRDSIPLFAEDPPSAVARIELAFRSGPDITYQLPLAVRPAATPPAPSRLADVEASGESGVLFDALDDGVFRERLGATFAAGASFGSGASRWVVRPLDDVGRGAVAPGSPALPISSEQSNSSIVYGQSAILKLYRRVEPGENPDAEIGQFLATRTRFRNVPRLFGTIRFEEPGAEPTVAGMLQAFLAGARDGWSYALDRIAADLARSTAAPFAFASEARRLGEITGGLHDALASDPKDPEFRPEPVFDHDLVEWGQRIERQAEQALERLSALATNPEEVARWRTIVATKVPRALSALGGRAGSRIRHHGDYHLGQVLRTEDGDFVILDFEGEPARPLSERRKRHSPLRDVAGMLRSIDYAAAAGLRAASRNTPKASSISGAWRDAARTAFLSGYRARAPSAHLPPSEIEFERLLDLFELEKALYEVAYEADNRPDWVDIPMAGLRALLASGETR